MKARPFKIFHSFEISLQSMTMWKWGRADFEWFWWLEMLSMMICCWWWYRCWWWWLWLWRWGWQWCWLFQLQPGSMHRASGISIAEWPIHISPIPLHSLFTERQKIQRKKKENINKKDANIRTCLYDHWFKQSLALFCLWFQSIDFLTLLVSKEWIMGNIDLKNWTNSKPPFPWMLRYGYWIRASQTHEYFI